MTRAPFLRVPRPCTRGAATPEAGGGTVPQGLAAEAPRGTSALGPSQGSDAPLLFWSLCIISSKPKLLLQTAQAQS